MSGVPDLHRLVVAPADDAFAVGAERHADDMAGVPLEGEDFLARVARPRPSRVLSSAAAETMRLPSGLNATLLTPSRVPLEGEDFLARRRRPTLRPSWSPTAVAMRLPSGLNATLTTAAVCPLRVRISWPVSASHTFTVLSRLPVTMRLPSGLNATLSTQPRVSLEGEQFLARLASHTFTVSS